jgi:GT2 family glycosyltransferase
MSNSPHVFVSVLNWNAPERTIRCLESLQKCKYLNKTIQVVDNASSDNSIIKIKEVFPQIKIIRSTENLGYAGGHELAVREAKQMGADLFWILNNDLTVVENSLTELVEAYLNSNKACLFGSVSFEGNNMPVDASWNISNTGVVEFTSFINLKPYYQTNGNLLKEKFITVANLHGCSLLIPFKVIKQHGFIDTSFFLYGEEIDYCLKLNRVGVKSILVISSKVMHESQGSYKHNNKLKKVMAYYLTRNVLILDKRYRSRKFYYKKLRYNCEIYLKELINLLLLRETKASIYEFYGFIDALFGRMGKRYKPENYL